MTMQATTTTDAAGPRAQQAQREPLSSRLGAFAASLRWAMEVQRRFERESARGRRPDGDAVRRIARETDAWLAGR